MDDEGLQGLVFYCGLIELAMQLQAGVTAMLGIRDGSRGAVRRAVLRFVVGAVFAGWLRYRSRCSVLPARIPKDWLRNGRKGTR
jgi:hypothetical protein